MVIRTSVRSLQASSGLSGRGHYHWLISGFWSILAALRISHFSPLTHTHTHLGTHIHTHTHTIDCNLGMIATPPLPYRVRVIGSSHKCLCEETREGKRCDWVFKSYNKPIRFREMIWGFRRSKPKLTNPAIFRNQ